MFAGGGEGCKTLLYHPARSCKMQISSDPFCPVCLEQMVQRLYDRIQPLEGGLVKVGSSVMGSVARGDQMRTRWYLDGKLVQDTAIYQPLAHVPEGKHTVHMVAWEDSAPVRKDRCDLVFAQTLQY